jgi:hypothetical protein
MHLYQQGDPSLRLLVQWVSEELAETKEHMVSVSPDGFAKLQGEAQAFKKIVDVLTNARKIGS